jgi:rare lipoprotein A (peptidoglycan hydrolase)
MALMGRTCAWVLALPLIAACASNHVSETKASAATVPKSPLHGFDPRTYYDKRALSTQRGAASYYADFFAGRLTANGERYDPDAYTAAHRTLPFGSVVRVVYEKTGDWVLVRVNDRGPYAKGRIIDLSRRAATRLSMLKNGVVRVRVELLERGAGKYVKKRQ